MFVVLAHGSGIDELAIFIFPVVMGLGFWLLTRQKSKGGDDEESETEAGPAVARIASAAPNDPKPVNGGISPFHVLVRPPARASDGDGAPSAEPSEAGTSA